MRKNLARSVLLVLVTVFGLALSLYMYAQDFFHAKSDGRLSVADQCENPALENAGKENPNKMLFISCGGFFE